MLASIIREVDDINILSKRYERIDKLFYVFHKSIIGTLI